MNKFLLDRLLKDQSSFTEDEILHMIDKLNYDIVICPNCGKVTLDSWFVCECGVEFGYDEGFDFDAVPVCTNIDFESEEHLEKFLKEMKKCLQTSEDSI